MADQEYPINYPSKDSQSEAPELDYKAKEEVVYEDVKLRVIVLVLIIILAVALFSYVGYSILKKKGVSFEFNLGGSNSESLSAIDQLKACSSQEDLTPECNLLYIDTNIRQSCSELRGSVKDKCFYRTASANRDSSYCNDILDESYKNTCIQELSV